jgi:hypothetical protein
LPQEVRRFTEAALRSAKGCLEGKDKSLFEKVGTGTRCGFDEVIRLVESLVRELEIAGSSKGVPDMRPCDASELRPPWLIAGRGIGCGKRQLGQTEFL